MIVVSILCLLLVALLVYWFVLYINEYTLKNYNYEFFTTSNYLVSAIGYASLYFGNNWYEDALVKHGDILNGQILLGIGLLLIVLVIYTNIKNTSFFLGLFFSILQQILYCILAIAGAFALMMMLAALSQTRPVYKIN